MEKVIIEQVSKTFISTHGLQEVLSNITLTIDDGDFICLLGPSGCGKTTLMNLIAGFERPTSGTVIIDGELVIQPNPKHITIFQDYGLFPWRTVLANVTFGLEAKGITRTQAQATAMEYLELVGLTAAAGQFPRQLSGGMKQRVAIARALAVEPDILLMDEPFGALDAFTRYRLQDELLRIWHEKKPTIIFVTHDIDEAVYLGQKVVIMAPNPGKIKTVLPINLPNPPDRSGEIFGAYRREVFRAFEMVQEDTDYHI
ncbi:nitrate ABC transporter ATP-binding protein [Sporomusaceae bacterium FL31]|nr:nitrate ABC transporter ATP-binding protein [Sporomusaceae bacterium FL31]GCE33552.1 nitrate ABC transporter ATP-binding protein [Sporomusaceae bacterium]